MLQHFEVYINSQKTMATYMMVFGGLIFTLSIIVLLAGTNPLLNGFKYGLWIFGLLSLIGGYGYKLTEERLLTSQTAIYHANKEVFKQVEKERMQKVVKSFPVIQIVFVVIILIALLLVFFINQSFIQGLLFALVLYFAGNLLIEQVSKHSIYTYFEQLTTMK